MPQISIAEETYRRLTARAAVMKIPIEELVGPVLDQLAGAGQSAIQGSGTSAPVAGDAWIAELEAWKSDAESRDSLYPPAFALDDSRETVYREREDAQY